MRARGQQQLGHALAAAVDGGGDRRNALGVGEVHVGARLDQQLGGAAAALGHRAQQRGAAGEVLVVDLRSRGQQRLHRLGLVASGSEQEGCVAQAVARPHRGALFQEAG